MTYTLLFALARKRRECRCKRPRNPKFRLARLTRFDTGQRMAREKKFVKVIELFLESGKIDILKKSQGKLE